MAEDKYEEKRKTLLNESRHMNNTLGLFSHAPSLAISDNSYHIPKRRNLTEEGTVKTAPKNFNTSPGKKGTTNDTTFGRTAFLAESADGSVIRKTAVLSLSPQKTGRAVHEKPFRTGSDLKPKIMSYDYMHPFEHKKIQRRDTEGAVIVEPRNFQTNPAKKGHAMTPGCSFLETRRHMSEPFGEQHRREIAEIKAGKAKQQDKPFTGMGYTGNAFNSTKSVYYDSEVKRHARPDEKIKPVEPRDIPPFKPASNLKTHKKDTLQPFPEYKENPLTFTKRKEPEEKYWKPNSSPKSTPVTTVIGAMKNVRAEMRSLNMTTKF